MTYREFRGCYVKKPYTDKAEAEGEKARIVSLPGVFAPERLEVYTCSWCGKLHIGHVSLKELGRRGELCKENSTATPATTPMTQSSGAGV